MQQTPATKSAGIAEANEERSKYGWSVTLHPDGDHYVLRNTGSLAAHDVKFTNQDQFELARFLVHDGKEGPVIQPHGAKAFSAISTFNYANIELVIDWLPEGESTRRTHNEAIPPMPSRAFDAHVKERKEVKAAETLERVR